MTKKIGFLLLVIAAIIISGCLGGNPAPPGGGPGPSGGGGTTSPQEKPRVHAEVDRYNDKVTFVHDGGGSVALSDVKIEISYDIDRAVWDSAGSDEQIFRPGDRLVVKTPANQIQLNGVETKHSYNDQPVRLGTGGIIKIKMTVKSIGAVIVDESYTL